jgi:hypothetical protein
MLSAVSLERICCTVELVPFLVDVRLLRNQNPRGLRFVESHPCAYKTAQGWGTRQNPFHEGS